ncbi:MAG TPA: hypothetical protein VH143_01410 [Kofleriaceae bacterium]|nr:hypothetical protein [Kofleriaceae bacterium]
MIARASLLMLLVACGSSKSTVDGPAGLGSGAACDISNDQCAAGLKCCTEPPQPPHTVCSVPTGSGTCPLLP